MQKEQRKSDPKYTSFLVSAMMALAMSFTVSLVATTLRLGLGPKLMPTWLIAFGISAVVAIPTAILVSPLAQGLVRAARQPKFASVLVPAVMALAMSFTMSLVTTTIRLGLVPNLLAAWLNAFAIGAVVAIPTAILVSPLARRLSGRLTHLSPVSQPPDGH
jgi:Protein of unknown function (DUF2798)